MIWQLLVCLGSIATNTLIYALQNFAPMNINQLKEKLFQNYENGSVSDDDLVQLIELASNYLNLKTITNYAKANKITYNGALKRKLNKVIIDSQIFIIDNE